MPITKRHRQQGVTLIELIAFILIVSLATGVLFRVYFQVTRNSLDPVIQIRLLETAQSKLDQVLALKYDEATPTGGIPACGSTTGAACTNSADANMNDVDDFNGAADTPYTGFTRTVAVTAASNIKRVQVTVVAPNGERMVLTGEKVNF
jgi:MSHA pilin protein MshD